MIPNFVLIFWSLTNLVVVSPLRIDTTNFGLQEFKAFVTNSWDVIQALDASDADLEISKTTDRCTELDRTLEKWHYNTLHFKVRAENDAFLCLTTTPTNPVTGPMIEIVIGAASNTLSVIRRGDPHLKDKVVLDTRCILGPNEYRGFWVRWGHVVSVGREGVPYPFMTWADPEPFHPTYVGVHTGYGATGDWIIEDRRPFHTPDNKVYVFRRLFDDKSVQETSATTTSSEFI